MKTALAISCLFLCSCDDAEDSPKFWEQETFRQLPVPTQIAVTIYWPLFLVGIAACIRAGK